MITVCVRHYETVLAGLDETAPEAAGSSTYRRVGELVVARHDGDEMSVLYDPSHALEHRGRSSRVRRHRAGGSPCQCGDAPPLAGAPFGCAGAVRRRDRAGRREPTRGADAGGRGAVVAARGLVRAHKCVEGTGVLERSRTGPGVVVRVGQAMDGGGGSRGDRCLDGWAAECPGDRPPCPTGAQPDRPPPAAGPSPGGRPVVKALRGNYLGLGLRRSDRRRGHPRRRV